MSNNANRADELAIVTRQLELQKLQIKLNKQFNSNMLLFQKAAPWVFEVFSSYTPKKHCISFTPEGYLTLVNINTNHPIYKEKPTDFCDTQLKEYKQSPLCLRLNFLPSGIANPDYIHAPLLNKLIESYAAMSAEEEITLSAPIGFMIIAGCGLGYHITELVNMYEIANLLIVEPDLDSFYASLHTIDWRPILIKLTQEHRTIKLCVGNTAEAVFAEIKQLPDEIGLHNTTNTFLYKHLNNPEINHFMSTLIKGFHQLATGVGFFDDERISLAHTLANIEKNIEVLCTEQTEEQASPAIIVGNGPSLDALIDQLKNASDNAIIFSCGTALGALYKAGIKPDYHVEVERTLNIKSWIENGTSPEFRKGITLLTLNTCPPGVIDLFDKTILSIKPNDLGGKLLKKQLKGSLVAELPYCNPTVANCALSFSIAMKFKEIHLAGIDLGAPAEKSFHSTLSLYEPIIQEEQKQRLIKAPWEKKKNPLTITVKGNKSPAILTTTTLDTARTNIETLLQQSASVQCFNPNWGAFIKHTTTSDDICINNKIKRAQAVSTLRLNKTNLKKTISTIQKQHEVLSNQLTHLCNQPVSENSFYKKTYKCIQDSANSKEYAHVLMKGSVNSFLAIIARHSNFISDQDDQNKALSNGISIYRSFLEQSVTSIKDNLRVIDKTKSTFNFTNMQTVPTKNQKILTKHFTQKEFDEFGFSGPFKIKNSQSIDTLMGYILEIEDVKKTLNRHKNTKEIHDILSDPTIQSTINTLCAGKPHFWGSQIRWFSTKKEQTIWHHTKMFEDAIGSPIEFSRPTNNYQLIIALDDIRIKNGTWKVIPLSHLTLRGCERSSEPSNHQTHKTRHIECVPEAHEKNAEYIELNKGEFLLLHASLIRSNTAYIEGSPSKSLVVGFTTNKHCVPDNHQGY